MSFSATAKLGGTAAGVTVGKIGHGLMYMTWGGDTQRTDEELFDTLRASLDAVPPGAKMFINSGEFYGDGFSPANLQLLARFFSKHPEYADRAFLSVKGGATPRGVVPDSSPENLRRSVDFILSELKGTKKLDLFETARVDSKVPVEDAMQTLKELVAEGKFDHVGLSECSAATIRRANAVVPIAAVEIELSPLSYEEETKKVLAVTEELGIAVIAYSPIGRGLLTMTKADELPEGSSRAHFTRFKGENLEHNLKIANALRTIALKKGVTPAQLSIAWVASLGAHVIPIPGSTHKGRTLENFAAGNIQLSEEEVQEIQEVVEAHGVKGDRYYGGAAQVHLWG